MGIATINFLVTTVHRNKYDYMDINIQATHNIRRQPSVPE